MIKMERFLPGFNHILCGKPPKTTLKRMEERLREFRNSTLPELEAVFRNWIPFEMLAPKTQGDHSRKRTYTLGVTFTAFLHQVLSPSTSCREVVRKVQSYCSEKELSLPSSATTAYCNARARLDEEDLEGIHEKLAGKVRQHACGDQLWKGREVKVIDGTGITLPDTEENQAEFPQPGEQRVGCGFPVMKIVGCFCLASGAFLKWAESSLRRHESRLFSTLAEIFRPGDVVLTDRGFCSYAGVAQTLARGADAVMRLHQRRKPDYRKGRKLGHLDTLIVWFKPVYQKGMDREEWEALPEEITVRYVRIEVAVKGFRVRRYDLVTTLLDPLEYTGDDLAELYFRRWAVELFFRHIKTTMGMEALRCKTPEMVRKELCMFVIAYNLIRALMQEAATLYGRDLTRMSFKATVDTLRQFSCAINAAKNAPKTRERVIDEMLLVIASENVPLRMNRSEPRAVKKRPKPYPKLTRKRSKYTVPKSRRNKGARKKKSFGSAA